MQRLFLIPALLLSLYSFSVAQSIKQTFSKTISPDSIKQDLFILASDSLMGRETGKPGQKKAAKFLLEKYASWGLSPRGSESSNRDTALSDYLQDHPISIRSNKTRNLSIGSDDFLYGKDFIYVPPPVDTPLIISKPLFIGANKKEVFQKSLHEKDFSNNNLVLLIDSLMSPVDIANILSAAPGKISSAFIITSESRIKKYFVHMDELNQRISFPLFFITEKVAGKIIPDGKLEKAKKKSQNRKKAFYAETKAELTVTMASNPDELRGQNVIALIPGSDKKDETIVISSHYDHLGIRDSLMYPGADDNASGTSAVLEIARVFSQAAKSGSAPRRNILIMNVSGEEKGLLGSSWFVSNSTVPMKSIVADLNIDMIGRTDSIHDSTGESHYIYIIGDDKLSTELRTINVEQNNLGPDLILDYKYNSPDDPNRFYSRSDHFNFAKNGIPVIFYFDGKHADYHKPTDTPDKINFDQLANRARLVFLTAWELANREDRIVVDKKADPAGK